MVRRADEGWEKDDSKSKKRLHDGTGAEQPDGDGDHNVSKQNDSAPSAMPAEATTQPGAAPLNNDSPEPERKRQKNGKRRIQRGGTRARKKTGNDGSVGSGSRLQLIDGPWPCRFKPQGLAF